MRKWTIRLITALAVAGAPAAHAASDEAEARPAAAAETSRDTDNALELARLRTLEREVTALKRTVDLMRDALDHAPQRFSAEPEKNPLGAW